MSKANGGLNGEYGKKVKGRWKAITSKKRRQAGKRDIRERGN